MDAITREEKILSGEPLTPITREEMFLAKAAGQAVSTPEPITRKEMFLSRIQGGGGGEVCANTLNEYLLGTKTEITAEDLSGVTVIGVERFRREPITSITIPKSLVSFLMGAFDFCNNLSKVYVSDILQWLNCSFANGGANPLNTGAALYIDGILAEDVEIPKSITTISQYAFFGCGSLKSITFLNSDTSIIGAAVFYNCRNLISVSLPNITAITNQMFQWCSSLVSIDIPDTVTLIGNRAFNGCTKLASITLPKGITTLEALAFENCKSLMEVVCLAETPPTIESNSFIGVPAECIYKVKPASVEAYKSATNWSVRADNIVALTEEEMAQYGG